MNITAADKKTKAIIIFRFASSVIIGILALFALFVYLNRSFGWFASNRNVAGRGMSVSVKTLGAEAEYFAYVYNVKENTVHYTGEAGLSAAEEPRIDNLDMQFHDTIFAQRNRYTPAIIRIRLTNISSEWAGGGKAVITISRDTSISAYHTNASTGNIELNEYFTSVMRFTAAQNKTWYDANARTLYGNIDAALYSSITAQTGSTESSKVFTTVTKTGSTVTGISKADSIFLKVAYTASDIVDGHLDIYLYLTYDSTLVSDFEHASGIDTSSTTVGKITEMVNDMTDLTVSFEAAD